MLPVFQILTLLKLLMPALARQITQYHIKWFSLVNSLSFSIHQINMYMSSTATPKPYPTSVQKAKMVKKKPYPSGRHIPVFAYNPSKQTPKQTSCFVNHVPVPPTAFNVCPFLFTVSYTGKLLLHSIAKFNIAVVLNL